MKHLSYKSGCSTSILSFYKDTRNELRLYNKIEMNKNLKKEVGTAIKVRKQVASYLRKKLLAFHSTGSTGYYLCLFMKAQFQLGSYIHGCTNETYSLANLQDFILVCVVYNYCGQSRD